MMRDVKSKILLLVILLHISAWINQDFCLAMEPVNDKLNFSSIDNKLALQDVELVGKDAAWLDYGKTCKEESFALSFKLENLTGTMCANINVNGSDHYAIGFINLGNNSLSTYLFKQAGKVQPSSIQQFPGKSIVYNPTQEYQVKINSEGGHIQVFIDKVGQERKPTPVVDYYDPEPLPQGKIDFETIDGSSAKLRGIAFTCSSPMNEEEPPNLGIGYFKPPG